MDLLCITAMLQLLLLQKYQFCIGQWYRSIFYVISNGYIANVSTSIEHESVKNIRECIRMCGTNPKCKSTNMVFQNNGNVLCTTLTVHTDYNYITFQEEANAFYYEIGPPSCKIGPVCSLLEENPCSPQICEDNATSSIGYRCIALRQPRNIASAGKATQSSTEYDGTPSRAIDNNFDAMFSSGSCSHTIQEPKPWWRLSLSINKIIFKVSITGRKDTKKKDLNGAIINIIKVQHNRKEKKQLCSKITDIETAKTKQYFCPSNSIGSIIEIKGRKNKTVELCEVEVFGHERCIN